jgi:putative membrane protein
MHDGVVGVGRSLSRVLVGQAPEEVGEAPDPRFSFANERTFLAWNRTALALISVGLAITQLLPPFNFTGGRRVIGLPLMALGAILSIASLREWASNERAMRLSHPLPASRLVVMVVVVIGVIGVVALVIAAVAGK